MFTLAICWPLPICFDPALTFQVPMQYCSLQHGTLLLSPVPSTTGCCFCFGSIPSFFLELFLHWSPVAYWAPTDLGSSSVSDLSFQLFITVHGVLGDGNGTPLQYSCLENPMDRRAWWAAVHRVAKSRIRLSDFTFTFYFHALEKEMAAHSSVLALRIPGMGEPAIYGVSQSQTRLTRLSSSSSSSTC